MNLGWFWLILGEFGLILGEFGLVLGEFGLMNGMMTSMKVKKKKLIWMLKRNSMPKRKSMTNFKL